MNIVKSFGVLTTGAYLLSNFCKSKFTVSKVDDQGDRYLSLGKKVRAAEWKDDWDCLGDLPYSNSFDSTYIFMCDPEKQEKRWKAYSKFRFTDIMRRMEARFDDKKRVSYLDNWPPNSKYEKLLAGYRMKDRESVEVNPTEHEKFVFNAQMECLFRSYFNRKKRKLVTFVTHPEVVQFFICRLLQIPLNRSHLFGVQEGSYTALTVNKDGHGSLRKMELSSIERFLQKMSDMAE